MHRTGSRGFYFFLIFFVLFALFLYGPMFSIILLSFQGPNGGLTFPMNGFSFHWFGELWKGAGVVDIGSAFRRSLLLGFVVMILTVVLSVAAGLAFRKQFRGAELLFLMTIASLIVPSIVLSLGVALEFRLLDETIKWFGGRFEIEKINYEFQTTLGMFTSGMGTQLAWALPFGLLIMFAVFNRFDKSYEEAARDLGATQWQTIREVVLPIIAPSIVGIGLFGFTLSYDELARSSQVMGATNTLPLELRGLTTTVTTPIIYALGTITTIFSFVVIGTFFLIFWLLSRSRSKVLR